MGSPTGGNPDTIATGAAALAKAATAVGTTAYGITTHGNSAADASGDARLAGALARFAAAWSETTSALHVQMTAAATLGRNAAADLAVAGGERPR